MGTLSPLWRHIDCYSSVYEIRKCRCSEYKRGGILSLIMATKCSQDALTKSYNFCTRSNPGANSSLQFHSASKLRIQLSSLLSPASSTHCKRSIIISMLRAEASPPAKPIDSRRRRARIIHNYFIVAIYGSISHLVHSRGASLKLTYI